jgi:hypothetical protein
VSENRELLDALRLANEDRAQLRTALEDANRRRQRAEREKGETERWLRHLERSRSWRLTRPLRDAVSGYRSLKLRVRSRSQRRV